MSCTTVAGGPYFGFTLAEMLDELERYKAARRASTPGHGVVSASENGSSFAFGPNSDMSLARWGVEIQRALHHLDPCSFPHGAPDRTVGVFR